MLHGEYASPTIEPDYAAIADGYFKSLGRNSPAALAKYAKIRGILLDTGALARVGGYLSAGGYDDAYREIRKLVGDKLIGSIPLLGPMGSLAPIWATGLQITMARDVLTAFMPRRSKDWTRGTGTRVLTAALCRR